MSAAPATRTLRPVSIGIRTTARPRAAWGARFLARSAAFGALAGLAFFASSLLGQVKLEEARREEASARARSLAARQQSRTLQASVDRLARFDSVRDWAIAGGFVATPGARRPSSSKTHAGLLAMR
jgi:hypothetical protein